MKIFVTGIGVISAIGSDVEENMHSLQSGITGITRSAGFDLMLGEVKVTNESIFNRFNLPQEDFSRTTLLALIAAKEAWNENTCNPDIRTGLISGTCVGGLDRMEKYYFQSQNNEALNTQDLMTHDNGRTTERLAKELGITGYIGTISTACSSGANAILQGARLIEGDKLDRAIVGGADPLTVFNMKGFSSLMIYDHELCRPFDDARKGLNLGEGAGFLVLENEHSIHKTGNIPLCLLTGWNNSSDAFHQTASSPQGQGATLAMTGALAKAKIAADRISYINAHGTGTDNNDLSESMAMLNVFGGAIPPFSSTKGFTGHTLGAAGAIEAVYCVQAIRSDALLPNLNFSTAMQETGLVPELTYRTNVNVEYALSNSFGFGGNCTCLIFSKVR
jgi:3-oxoacyl-[acyl-carrier-protein] synthase-1